jgi:hypothetical protein
MKADEPLIPLAGVRMVPRNLTRALFWVGIAFAVIATAMILGGLIAGELGRVLEQSLVFFGVAAYACVTAMLSSRSDRRPRVTAPQLWKHLQPRSPLPTRTFAVAFVMVVLATGLVGGWELALRIGLPGSGMLAGLLASVVLYRRQMHRQATVMFALYADGVLDAAATAAIDDARAKDPAFDAAVREHQRVCALVAAQLRG